MLYLAFDPAPSERGYNHYSTFVYPEEVQALTRFLRHTVMSGYWAALELLE